MNDDVSDLPVHPTLRHPLTGEPLQAVGVINGRAIWPVLGGAPDGDEGDGDDGTDDEGDEGDDDGTGDGGDSTDDDGDGEDDLGDKGKKALTRMKEQRKAALTSHRDTITAVAQALGSTPERVRAALRDKKLGELIAGRKGKNAGGKDGDDEIDAEQIRAEAEQEANAKANRRIVRADLKAAAAGKLADPSDAIAFIDLDEIEVGENGETDEDELAEAIDELLQRKPHLAAGKTGEPKFGKHNPGARRKAQQSIDEQIAAAEAKGDWATARSLKSQKLTAASK